MKKYIITLVLVISWLFSLSKANNALADWWLRPTALPTQPTFGRDLPPSVVDIRPTLPSNNPTTTPVAPTVTPPVGGAPTNPPSQGGNGSPSGDGNPCDPGKSFVGPNCGWSPNVDNSGTGGGGGGSSPSEPRIGSGPQVLGLSNTSSGDWGLSDIMILAGVLCLAVYARSKINVDQSR